MDVTHVRFDNLALVGVGGAWVGFRVLVSELSRGVGFPGVSVAYLERRTF